MSLVTLFPAEPYRHLKVSSEAWFYMDRIKNHADAAAHDHNYLELAFILEGRARHYAVEGESLCRKGDVFIIPVGAWHGYADCRGLEVMNCLFSPALLEKELAWMAEDAALRNLLGLRSPAGCVGIRRLRVMAGRFSALRCRLEELKRAYDKKASRMELLGHQLLLLEQVRLAASVKDLSGVEEGEGHLSVKMALEALHGDIAREWNLHELAARLRLNPSYLVRLFRSRTGMPPMKYLARVRADRAATLLLSSRLGVGEIGVRVGWPDPKQFARSFRQHFGISASVYRKRMLKPFLSGGKIGK